MKKKTVAVIIASAILLIAVVGGTLAWLKDTTDPVKNTFTVGDIDITLTETEGGTNRQFKMVPGCTIDKDPKVTVEAGSEKCYVFVKVEESTNPKLSDYITYNVDEGNGKWIKLTDVNNVWYRIVDAKNTDQVFSVLTGDKVTVKNTVTKEMMDALTTGNKLPTLTFTAYACQYNKNNTESFTAAEAWANVQPTTPTP